MRRTATAWLILWLLGISLVILGVGCVLSPKPEPPTATIDLDSCFLDEPSYEITRTLSGGPGAVEPPGAIVRATNLENDQAYVQRIVEEDGSFELTITIHEESEVRLQVISDEVRSSPLDIVFGMDSESFELAERALGHCLRLDPPLELDLEDSQTIGISNECGEPVTLESPRLRRALSGVQVGADHAWPRSLEDGESVAVEVTFDPDTNEELVVFLEASSPEMDRRPVTVVFPR